MSLEVDIVSSLHALAGSLLDNFGRLRVKLPIYYAHLAFVRFGHSVSHGSLMTTYITLLA